MNRTENKISVIIPVYKSSKSLVQISKDIAELNSSTGYSLELIFVNDSPFWSETCKILSLLEREYSNIRVITLRKNQGQHIALLVGISKSHGEYIITMDDDLQHPVSEIPKLISAIEENPEIEVVMAVPGYNKKKHSLWRNLGSYVLNKIDTYFLKKPKGLIKSPFRIMTKEIGEIIVKNYNAMPSVSSLIINSTDNIINIKVIHNKREYGKSNYTLRKIISLSLNNIIHYSSLPLKLVGMIGLTGFMFSVIFIIYVLIKKMFFGIDFPGYASTVSLISFFGGLNLLAVGFIGEYLIRIIKEQQKINLNLLIKK